MEASSQVCSLSQGKPAPLETSEKTSCELWGETGYQWLQSQHLSAGFPALRASGSVSSLCTSARNSLPTLAWPASCLQYQKNVPTRPPKTKTLTVGGPVKVIFLLWLFGSFWSGAHVLVAGLRPVPSPGWSLCGRHPI